MNIQKKIKRNIFQFIKFCVVGVFGASFNYLVFLFCFQKANINSIAPLHEYYNSFFCIIYISVAFTLPTAIMSIQIRSPYGVPLGCPLPGGDIFIALLQSKYLS